MKKTENRNNRIWRRALASIVSTGALSSMSLHAADIIISTDIAANVTWTANNNYILTKPVVVKPGFTLTIEPGTKILAVGDNKATTDRADDDYGSLVVARTAQLIADGTPSKPIIFDAYASVYGFDDNGRNTGPSGPRTLPLATRGFPQIQNTNSNGTGTPENPNFGATPATNGSPLKSGGLWGGVILLGRAPINFYENNGTQNFEKTIEGFPVANVEDLKYGADTAALWAPNDNSGVMRYVSLRFGGYEFQSGSEINGLTLGGVGNGTTIEHVEVVSNNDDGFEFFGGTVNTKYLVSAFNKDDSFDIDEGHQGKHQFWFALQNSTMTATFGDNGLELDGGFSPAISGVDQTNNLLPFTTPDIYNMTVIGKGINEAANAGMRLRDTFKGKIHNSLFTDLGVSIRAESTLDATSLPVFNSSVIGNMITTGNGNYRVSTSGSVANSNAIVNPTTPAATNTVASSATILTQISRMANAALDPRPMDGAVPFTHTRTAVVGTAIAEDISTVNYNGAFGKALWTDCWTYLFEKQYTAGSVVAGAPPFADADGDGISDAVEAANTALGFNAAANDASTVLGSLKTQAQFDSNFTAGQTSVTSNPSTFNLFTATSIQDLRGVGMMIGPVTAGGNATITLPLFKSTGLNTWEAAGNATATVPTPAGKQFFRIDLSNNAPNP